ncbi:MAG: L,D-transpeptidase family protein [Candidatus Binataceae bacterium]
MRITMSRSFKQVQRRRVILVTLAVSLGLCWSVSYPPARDGYAADTAQTAPAHNAPFQNLQALRPLIDTGMLPDLRWPNFTDYRTDVGKFYESGGYALAWVQANQATPQALAMIQLFKQASLKGLNPEDYDASRWDARLAKLQSPASPQASTDLVRFDLALTVCAMRYISDLHIGRVNPRHFKFGLDVGSKRYDLPELLRNQIIAARDANAAIAKIEPPYAGYRRAEVALAHYLKLDAEGDGAGLPVPEETIRPGDSYAGMAQLIWRLRQLGDIGANSDVSAEAGVYQGDVVNAVKHFQWRHGLEPDGLLGKGTIAQLNTPLSYRVWQLQLDLERYRWLPPHFPEPPILVNIPEFILRTMRRQPASFIYMNVVVGKAYRSQTPVFAENMKYVVFRPYWNVPSSIQRSELVPKTTRNRNYLASHGYEVVNGAGAVVTSGSVSDDVLSGLRAGRLRIRQKPGPKNSLGLVKFIFPNDYNVYLHSTPSPQLFSRARRDFSHGCIRVQDPVALAAWVLRDNPDWNVERIRAVMNGDRTVQINLVKPIPVLILYSTAVVDPDGTVRFFDDIYGYDASLEKVLAGGYPYP